MSEFQKEECGIFAATLPQFNELPSFGTLAFRNALEYCNFDFSMLISNHFSTLCKNLVRFSSVTWSLRCKNLNDRR